MSRIVVFAAVVLVVLAAVFGCAQRQVVQREFTPGQMHHISEFKMLSEAGELNNNVAYLDPGDTVPLKLSVESAWVGIQQDHVDLVARRRIYFMIKLPEHISKERLATLANLDQAKLFNMSEADKAELFKDVMLYASNDAVRWAPLNDGRALKEVFEIERGTLSFGVGMNMSEGLWTALAVEALNKE